MYPASVEYLNRQWIIPNWRGGLWEQIYTYIFFPFFSFSECVCVCFCVWFVFIALLLPFVLGFCLSVYFWLLVIFQNFFLIIIFYFNNVFILFYFTLFYFVFLLSFFLFFLLFILSRVEERLLVIQPGIRAMPLRWESQVQDTGPQETSQLHVISNGKNLPEISISTPRPGFTQRPASYSAGNPMPNN